MNKKRNIFARVFLLASVVNAALLGVSPHSALAAPEPSAVPAPAPAPASNLKDGNPSLKNTGGSADGTDVQNNSAVCSFITRGDNVHRSSSAFEASGHGWWTNINCNSTSAVVTVQLQQYYSDGSWRNAGTVGRATVRSGGGSGYRATGRAACYSNSQTGWRSLVDVNVVGIIDDPGKLTTPSVNVFCRH